MKCFLNKPPTNLQLLGRRGPGSPDARLFQHYVGQKMTFLHFSKFLLHSNSITVGTLNHSKPSSNKRWDHQQLLGSIPKGKVVALSPFSASEMDLGGCVPLYVLDEISLRNPFRTTHQP